jgi:hypothetical protein
MTKAELRILGKAFAAEVNQAVSSYKGAELGVLQTRSALAWKLVETGHLMHVQVTTRDRIPLVLDGYTLTDLGRMTYCMSC